MHLSTITGKGRSGEVHLNAMGYNSVDRVNSFAFASLNPPAPPPHRIIPCPL